jgi:tripartite-type tricarboxylate transporter receptor subunit TctC
MKAILSLIAGVLVATGAWAQSDYPSKPVTLVTPFAAGSGPDAVLRLVADKLGRLWNQRVVVDNKPGGGGFIAIDQAKRAAPDGYTLLQSDAPPMTVHPYLFKKIPFEVKDFEPLASMYRTYYFVTVASDSKWNTLGDLIAAAKAKPNALTYGSSGTGGNLHLGGAMMERGTGAKMTHVPYKETTQIYIDISKGDVDWAVGTASTTSPMFKAGKVKYLAITAPKRSPLFPDIPTVTEAGGPAGYELQTWVSLFTPRGVPKAIVSKINADVAKALQEPDVREKMNAVGFEPLVQTPDELQKMMNADAAKYSALIKAMNISLD